MSGWMLRCMFALLLAMAAALGAGLLAWGPIGPGAHHFAEREPLLGVAGLANALASLPMAAMGLAGVTALGRSRWPRDVTRPWRGFFAVIGAASLSSALYHLLPSDGIRLLGHLLLAAAQMLLLSGFLAERVSPRFGSPGACAAALALPMLAALGALAERASGDTLDFRGLLLLQLLPVLLLPAGALGIGGRVTRAGDWLVMLMLFALAKLFDAADAHLLAASGWISGHALMHVALAAAAGCLAYRALAAAPRGSAGSTAVESPSHRITSARTAG